MKSILIIAGLVSVVGLGFVFKNNLPWKKSMSNSTESIAVLELFTSEGCSSCPPADKLLPELTKLYTNVISLSFHVDYWNRLGWKDPFSSAEFSERQKQYGNQFQLQSIYTPQLIINGKYELVGSNRNSATATIEKALTEKATVQPKIDLIKQEDNKLIVTCSAQGDLKKLYLLAALVQIQATVKVKAGENNGALLTHTNVVRSFVKQPAEAKTTFTLQIPEDVANDNWNVIVYAQQSNLKITGAAIYKKQVPNVIK